MTDLISTLVFGFVHICDAKIANMQLLTSSSRAWKWICVDIIYTI